MGCIGGQREHAGDESGDGFFGAEINRAPASLSQKKSKRNDWDLFSRVTGCTVRDMGMREGECRKKKRWERRPKKVLGEGKVIMGAGVFERRR